MLSALLWLILALPTTGRVLTAEGSYQGELELKEGVLRCGNRTIPWDQVIRIVTDRPSSVPSPHLVRFQNGERWYGRILGLEGGLLRMKAEPLGKAVEIPVGELLAVDFIPGYGEEPALGSQGLLQRAVGTPVTGTLVRIDDQAVTLSSNLGQLRFAPYGLLRYLWPSVALGPAGGDRVGLIDGTLLACEPGGDDPSRKNCLGPKRDQATGKDSLGLRHARLGEMHLPLEAVGFVLRTTPLATRLIRGPGAASPWGPAVLVKPGSPASFELEAQGGRCSLLASPGSEGGVLEALLDGKSLAQVSLSSVTEWTFELPPGGNRLSLRVTGPARVTVADPCLVLKR